MKSSQNILQDLSFSQRLVRAGLFAAFINGSIIMVMPLVAVFLGSFIGIGLCAALLILAPAVIGHTTGLHRFPLVAFLRDKSMKFEDLPKQKDIMVTAAALPLSVVASFIWVSLTVTVLGLTSNTIIYMLQLSAIGIASIMLLIVNTHLATPKQALHRSSLWLLIMMVVMFMIFLPILAEADRVLLEASGSFPVSELP